MKKKNIILLLAALIAVFHVTMAVGATSIYGDSRFRPLYPYLEVINFVSSAIRMLMWGLILFLSWIVDGISSGLLDLIRMPHQFFESNWISEVMTTVNTISFLLLAPVLIFLGYKVWTKSDQNHELTKKIIRNSILTMCILGGFSWLMTLGNQLMQASVSALLNDTSTLTLSEEMVRGSILDLEYAHSRIAAGSSFNSLNRTNSLTSEGFQFFNINERANREIFNRAIVFRNGTIAYEDLADGLLFTSIGEEFLYRYQIMNPLGLILQLIAIAIAFVFSGIKFARLIFELGFKRVIAAGVGVFDIEGSGKFKTLITDIWNTFVLMFLVVLLFVLYIRFATWINILNVNLYVRILLQIGGALALIDGPKIVEKLTGHDAGLSADAVRTMHFGSSMLRTAKGFAGSFPHGKSSDDGTNGEDKAGQEQGASKDYSSKGDQKPPTPPTEGGGSAPSNYSTVKPNQNPSPQTLSSGVPPVAGSNQIQTPDQPMDGKGSQAADSQADVNFPQAEPGSSNHFGVFQPTLFDDIETTPSSIEGDSNPTVETGANFEQLSNSRDFGNHPISNFLEGKDSPPPLTYSTVPSKSDSNIPKVSLRTDASDVKKAPNNPLNQVGEIIDSTPITQSESSNLPEPVESVQFKSEPSSINQPLKKVSDSEGNKNQISYPTESNAKSMEVITDVASQGSQLHAGESKVNAFTQNDGKNFMPDSHVESYNFPQPEESGRFQTESYINQAESRPFTTYSEADNRRELTQKTVAFEPQATASGQNQGFDNSMPKEQTAFEPQKNGFASKNSGDTLAFPKEKVAVELREKGGKMDVSNTQRD
jgi:hypothetical protein